jgi:hypothetical protein
MAIIAKTSKTDFTPAPEGLWAAVCCDVVDLGMLDSPWGERHQVEIRWQLEEHDSKVEKPFMVVQRYTLSLHEKSRLRPMLEAWRGRKFSHQELEGFDLEKLLGANCQIQVVHDLNSEGTVRAKVQAVVPAAKGAAKLRVNTDYIRMVERAKRTELEKNPNGKPADDEMPF